MTEHEIQEQLLEKIERLSSSYVPEWRFNRAQPDMGSALAILFAEMMAGAAAARARMMEQYRVLFFQCLKAEPEGAKAAEGYLTFNLEKDDLPETVVPAGSLVEGDGADGQRIGFRTVEDVYVSASAVDPIRVIDGMWYLRFTRAPSQGLLSLLFLLKGASDRRMQALEWSYYGTGGWSPLPVSDATDCLSRTGLVKFAGSPDFKEQKLLGVTGWWLRVKAVEEEPPDGVYLNAGKVIAAVSGEEGNLPSGTELELDMTAGFVSQITNPDILWGGSRKETTEECLRRCSAAIRHGGRAVSPGDLERLASEASGDIERIKCFNGCHSSGKRQPGVVTLVVLQKNYLEGGRYFYRLREQIRDSLADRISTALAAGGGLEITAPWFVRIDVSARLYVTDYGRVIPVKLEAETRLEQYLNPVSGGYDGRGWEFGSIPDYDQISHMLQRIDGVRYVRQVCLTVWLDRGKGQEETEWEKVSRLPWTLPVNGRHQIQIGVGENKIC